MDFFVQIFYETKQLCLCVAAELFHTWSFCYKVHLQLTLVLQVVPLVSAQMEAPQLGQQEQEEAQLYFLFVLHFLLFHLDRGPCCQWSSCR